MPTKKPIKEPEFLHSILELESIKSLPKKSSLATFRKGLTTKRDIIAKKLNWKIVKIITKNGVHVLNKKHEVYMVTFPKKKKPIRKLK